MYIFDFNFFKTKHVVKEYVVLRKLSLTIKPKESNMEASAVPSDPQEQDPLPTLPVLRFRDPVPFSPGSESGMNIPDYIYESIETIF